MNRPRTYLLLTLMGMSLALNAAFVADHARRGTIRRLFVRMDLAAATVDRSDFQASMEARYRKLPIGPGQAVFAGDSLIFNGPWTEYFPETLNRGIPNETSALLLGRLGDITRHRPRRLILLTGANDINQGVPVPQLVRNYRSILEKTRADCPATELTVIGMLPVDPALPGVPHHDNEAIRQANRQIEDVTHDFPTARFLDLTPLLADDAGKLRREFTDDGLHLTVEGYLAVLEAVRARLGGPGPAAEVTRSTDPTEHRPAPR